MTECEKPVALIVEEYLADMPRVVKMHTYVGEHEKEKMLVFAKSEARGREQLRKIGIKISVHKFRTYWPIEKSNLYYDSLANVVGAEGVWKCVNKDPEEFERITVVTRGSL